MQRRLQGNNRARAGIIAVITALGLTPVPAELLIPTALSSSTSDQQLELGAVLTSPQEDTSYNTPLGRIAIAKSSIVLLVRSDGYIGIYDIYERKRGGAAVTAGK